MPEPSEARANPEDRAAAQSKSAPAEAGRGGIPRPAKIFDPVARALDVIGDRWTLVLLRQLLLGPKGFQEMRVRTGIAPRVLSGRLRQLVSDGLVETQAVGTRSVYAVTERGRSLEVVINSLGRWWVQHGIQALEVDVSRFTETSAQSIVEALPLMLREDRAGEAEVTFEIRLTGEGGGVWTVRIDRGRCFVRGDFAEGADVRYTADAKVWCALALGLVGARDLINRGLLTKEGGPQAMDHYFHQVSQPATENAADELFGAEHSTRS